MHLINLSGFLGVAKGIEHTLFLKICRNAPNPLIEKIVGEDRLRQLLSQGITGREVYTIVVDIRVFVTSVEIDSHNARRISMRAIHAHDNGITGLIAYIDGISIANANPNFYLCEP